jgi:hypothetical protein
VPESAAHYAALFLGTALPPVSRMASEIGDKHVCGGLFGGARGSGYDAPAPHKTLTLLVDGECFLTVFFLYSLSPFLCP